MVQLAGCEDGGCPGIWVDGDRILAQGVTVTDEAILARTGPAAGESVIALPKLLLGQAMATAITKLL
jgi:hypothetical protein